MGSVIVIFADRKDDLSLRGFANSIGLNLLHPMARKMTLSENEESFNDLTQGGFFSFLPAEKLHPYSEKKEYLCDVIDPLISYIRPYYQPPNLIAGQIHWKTDVKELARQTKPYFQKIKNWLKDNWIWDNVDKSFIGPEAEKLISSHDVNRAYLPPGHPIKTIETL